MKKRAIIATAVAFVLLLAVVAAGLNLVFTVSYMDVAFYAFSETGEREAVLLKEELDGFVGKSTTFLKQSDVEETVSKYPGFRLDGFHKKFPHTVEIKLSERRETYAFRSADGKYAVLDEAGNFLYDKDENANRTGGENILLDGFSFSVSAEGKTEGQYAERLAEVFSVLDETFTAPRANVLGIRLERPASDLKNDLFCFVMREGVKIDLLNPSEKTAEKMRAALEKYLSLKDGERICGRITVADAGGDIKTEYSDRIYGE